MASYYRSSFARFSIGKFAWHLIIISRNECQNTWLTLSSTRSVLPVPLSGKCCYDSPLLIESNQGAGKISFTNKSRVWYVHSSFSDSLHWTGMYNHYAFLLCRSNFDFSIAMTVNRNDDNNSQNKLIKSKQKNKKEHKPKTKQNKKKLWVL